MNYVLHKLIASRLSIIDIIRVVLVLNDTCTVAPVLWVGSSHLGRIVASGIGSLRVEGAQDEAVGWGWRGYRGCR